MNFDSYVTTTPIYRTFSLPPDVTLHSFVISPHPTTDVLSVFMY